MRRRVFLMRIAFAVLASPGLGQAQRADKVWRIGYLGQNSQPEAQHLLDAFRASLREQGWSDANIVMEYRFAHGNADRLGALAKELVGAGADVLVAPTDPQAIALKQATDTVPIVIVAAGDPVASGLVKSLARPGGNITGLSLIAPDLGGKRLELLKQAVRRLSRAAILWNLGNTAKAREVSETEAVAKSMGVTMQSVPVDGARVDLQSAFSAMTAKRAQAVIVLGDALTFGLRRDIAALALAKRLPTMWEVNIFMDAGGLMSYGPDAVENFRRSAKYVDRILKGAKPADLPVELPTKFELIVNIKTAKALALTLPSSLLSRADRIIE